MNDIKLTQYSHGAGCGCKIAPNVLTTILKTNIEFQHDAKLLVGNDSRDDAAVYDLGDGTAIISTTDFFMPIVDDPETFGKIAAINAMSDIYAMGGQPLLAIAILGWPIDKLDAEIAQRVVDGGRLACKEAGIALAGGHSIDSPEPIFGLAVTGRVKITDLKQNNTAKAENYLYLTKPLGIGILTTAEKRGILKPEHENLAAEIMCQLNKVASELSKLEGVTAMTDVTGFSLLGHLCEICEGSGVSAEIEFDKIPKIDGLQYYIDQKSMPGGTFNNWNSYGHLAELKTEDYKAIICDPQTSGGLLIAVNSEAKADVERILKKNNLYADAIGKTTMQGKKLVSVI